MLHLAGCRLAAVDALPLATRTAPAGLEHGGPLRRGLVREHDVRICSHALVCVCTGGGGVATRHCVIILVAIVYAEELKRSKEVAARRLQIESQLIPILARDHLSELLQGVSPAVAS